MKFFCVVFPASEDMLWRWGCHVTYILVIIRVIGTVEFFNRLWCGNSRIPEIPTTYDLRLTRVVNHNSCVEDIYVRMFWGDDVALRTYIVITLASL